MTVYAGPSGELKNSYKNQATTYHKRPWNVIYSLYALMSYSIEWGFQIYLTELLLGVNG